MVDVMRIVFIAAVVIMTDVDVELLVVDVVVPAVMKSICPDSIGPQPTIHIFCPISVILSPMPLSC